MFEARLLKFLFVVTAINLALVACGGSSSGNNPLPSSSSSSSSSTSSSSSSSSSGFTGPAKTMDGTVTFDFVPFSSNNLLGLSYDATEQRPVRGVIVQAIEETNSGREILAETITDENGYYSFEVPQNRFLKVRVRAEMTSILPRWHISVKDNTRDDANYILDGQIADSAGANLQTRNLHAISGWTGSAYTQARSAAAFAILDAIYDSLKLIESVDNDVILENLDVFWSVFNTTVNGNLAEGEIGTSYYSINNNRIYVLGRENNDTDEYDRTVIQHEFLHFIEDVLFRTDSTGGVHKPDLKQDMRLTFSEGLGNVFAAISGNSPLYKDSSDTGQHAAFTIDMEQNSYAIPGFYNEGSIQSILYDIFDENSDDVDEIELGFAPIYQTLASDTYKSFTGATSIYLFADTLKAIVPDSANAIDALLSAQNITVDDPFGSTEQNIFHPAVTAPLYRELAVGDLINVCSDNTTIEFNGVDVNRFIRLNVDTPGRYTIRATKNNSMLSDFVMNKLEDTNPDFELYRRGEYINRTDSSTLNSDELTANLVQDEYLLVVYESANRDDDLNGPTGGLACFDVSVE